MKFLIFSDSHGNTDTFRRVITAHPDAQGIVFLGDGLRDLDAAEEQTAGKTLIKVRGNCDSFLDPTPTFASFSVDGIRVAVMHGHEQQVKLTDSRLYSLAGEGYDLILHGHTHIPREDRISVSGRTALICNPGSAHAKQFGILTIQNGQYLYSNGRLS